MNTDDFTRLERDKDSLINLILWYRDEWHRKDFGHEEIRKASTSRDLEIPERIVDGWLDADW